MRRALLLSLAFAALTTVLGGVPAPARGSCSAKGYDDRCETRSLLVRSRVGNGVLPFYAPASGTLVAAGTGTFEGDTVDILVKAFDARTGRRRWSRSYGGGRNEILTAGALGPGGRTVLLAGTTMRAGRRDWVVASFSVRTGRLAWERTFGGRGGDAPTRLVVDARNDSVYVGGHVSRGQRLASAVVAYDASSGSRLWVRERRPVSRDVAFAGIELQGPDLYVLENTFCRTSGCSGDGPEVTRGAPTRSGFHGVWTRGVDGSEGTIQFGSAPLAASREGVAVGGTIDMGGGDEPSYLVSFHERQWGRRRWTALPNPAGRPDVTYPLLAADPAGRRVIVGDASVGTASSVRAIGTSSGQIEWVRPFPGGRFAGTVYDVAVGRTGVYATGMAGGRNETISPATVHFGPEGRRRWVARYAAGHGWEEGVGSYVVPRGRGAAVVLGTPANLSSLARDDWVGYATYRDRE